MWSEIHIGEQVFFFFPYDILNSLDTIWKQVSFNSVSLFPHFSSSCFPSSCLPIFLGCGCRDFFFFPLHTFVWWTLPQVPKVGLEERVGFTSSAISLLSHDPFQLPPLTSHISLLSNCLFSGSFAVCPGTISTFTLVSWIFHASWGASSSHC